jgi:hypothetical protein
VYHSARSGKQATVLMSRATLLSNQRVGELTPRPFSGHHGPRKHTMGPCKIRLREKLA